MSDRVDDLLDRAAARIPINEAPIDTILERADRQRRRTLAISACVGIAGAVAVATFASLGTGGATSPTVAADGLPTTKPLDPSSAAVDWQVGAPVHIPAPGEPCVDAATIPTSSLAADPVVSGALPRDGDMSSATAWACPLPSGTTVAITWADGTVIYYEPNSFHGNPNVWFEGMAQTWGGSVIVVDDHLGYVSTANSEPGVIHEALFVEGDTVIRVQAPADVDSATFEKIVRSFQFAGTSAKQS